MRFGLEMVDLSDIADGCGFKVFAQTVANGGVVKAINAKGGVHKLSRRDIDALTKYVAIYGAKGLAYFQISDENEVKSPLLKFLSEEEVKAIFADTVVEWFKDNIIKETNRKPLMTALWDGEQEKATSILTDLLFQTISYHNYKEDYYHAFLAGIFAGAGYMVDSNKEHGEGRSDVIVYDALNGRVAVFEAKYAKSLNDLDTACEKAVQQMDDLMYAKSFEDDYDEVICYGISFFKKRCVVKKK